MKKLFKILKQKSGASLLIVLACMMFLITLATITLTSSLGVASTTQHNKNKTQIELFAQSVQISLQDMLNSNDASGNLQTEIIKSFYNNDTAIDPTNAPPMFDKLTISVDETIMQADGTPTIVTHSVECEIDIQLERSASNFTGLVFINANIDLNPLDTNLSEKAEYRMGFSLDSALYDDTTQTVTNYGKWTLVEYEKVEN